MRDFTGKYYTVISKQYDHDLLNTLRQIINKIRINIGPNTDPCLTLEVAITGGGYHHPVQLSVLAQRGRNESIGKYYFAHHTTLIFIKVFDGGQCQRPLQHPLVLSQTESF